MRARQKIRRPGTLYSSNSDSVYVVYHGWRHKNCSPFRGILPLRGSSTPSLTAQQLHLDHGVLCSVRWQHRSRALSTTASVFESAHAAGQQQTRISNYVGYSWSPVGSNDWQLMLGSLPTRCCRIQRVWQVRIMRRFFFHED